MLKISLLNDHSTLPTAKELQSMEEKSMLPNSATEDTADER